MLIQVIGRHPEDYANASKYTAVLTIYIFIVNIQYMLCIGWAK
jgi:hypothetical protein